MIDPILSLAFSMHSNRGVYALLLGSGISRAAQIPTGWEVVLDLIQKLAHVQGELVDLDPIEWYRSRFHAEPDYSDLLDQLGRSAAERSQLLRAYFEPTEDEREQGVKLPTEAHKAIAELVVKGYIKVIITTNFDRLLEHALEAEGITPTVISTPDAVEGALPLQHTACTVINVHGDYRDARIKNTADELAQYEECIDDLLDRIFDEYGLIVCGWSGEWDEALRTAIQRCKSRRFTTYWTGRGEPTERAAQLIDLRRAQVIRIQDANQFFPELREKVFAIDEYSQPHPLSAALATATVKKYLVDDKHRIRLHDLVVQEAGRLCEQTSDERFPVALGFSPEEFVRRIQRYEALTSPLMAMVSAGCFWGTESQEGLWVKCLGRMANLPELRSGMDAWISLTNYPALLLLYAGGIAAIANDKYRTLKSLFLDVTVWGRGGLDIPLALHLNVYTVMKPDTAKKLPGREREFTPLSNHLFDLLRNPLREYLPDDTVYESAFVRFEYLLALVHAEQRQGRESFGWSFWAPAGRFGWKYRYSSQSIMQDLDADLDRLGDSWPPCQAGLFNGSADSVKSIKAKVDDFVRRLPWW